MRRSTILDLKKINFFEGILKNKILIILISSFVIGLTAGVFSYGKSEVLQDFAGKTLSEFISKREDSAFWNLTLASLSSSITFLIAIFLSGTSLLGIVLSPILIFIRGFSYGGFASLLYAVYGIKGIAINAVLVIPPSLIISLVLIFAAKYSISFAMTIARLTLPRTAPSSLYEDFKYYCTKYALLLPALFLSAIIDAILSYFFFSAFNL